MSKVHGLERVCGTQVRISGGVNAGDVDKERFIEERELKVWALVRVRQEFGEVLGVLDTGPTFRSEAL